MNWIWLVPLPPFDARRQPPLYRQAALRAAARRDRHKSRQPRLTSGSPPTPRSPLMTTVAIDTARRIITRNESPDISFDRSINPYRGCEHGCVYCYARPTHAYMGLSPGLDFESKLFVK